jgi:dihydrodipicolinate synthase/N-acetylneuraminate lyase
MAETTDARTDHPYEYVSNVGFRAGAKFYLERLAYTSRGNFAFVVGMLYSIYDMTSHAVTAGTPEATEPIFSGQAQSILGTLMSGLDGVLTVLVGIMAGVVVLLILDLYEYEVGLSIEAEN